MKVTKNRIVLFFAAVIGLIAGVLEQRTSSREIHGM